MHLEISRAVLSMWQAGVVVSHSTKNEGMFKIHTNGIDLDCFT